MDSTEQHDRSGSGSKTGKLSRASSFTKALSSLRPRRVASAGRQIPGWFWGLLSLTVTASAIIVAVRMRSVEPAPPAPRKARPTAPAPVAQAVAPAQPQVPGPTAAIGGAAGHAWYELALRADGMLAGRVTQIDSEGNLEAVQLVDVMFIQGGRVIVRAKPDEAGMFEVAGLTPGVFSMVITGKAGMAACAVRVLSNTTPLGSSPTPTFVIGAVPASDGSSAVAGFAEALGIGRYAPGDPRVTGLPASDGVVASGMDVDRLLTGRGTQRGARGEAGREGSQTQEESGPQASGRPQQGNQSRGPSGSVGVPQLVLPPESLEPASPFLP